MPHGTSESVRRANLSALLRSLYLHGPSSRSVLSSRSGRNRSTIASLVADLTGLGLVVENDPEHHDAAGRPSPVVSLRPETAAIAVNPEIDMLTITLVGLDTTIIQTIRHSYRRIPSAEEAISVTAAVIAGLELSDYRITGIGVAVPGQVRAEDGVIANAPHLHWVDAPFGEPLAEATGYPVRVANDAALGALAEHDFGAGRGLSDLIYVNGGASGIGSGAVSNGRLLRGAAGFAGELGHVRVSSSSATDSAGIAGTLEAMVTRSKLLATLGLDSGSANELTTRLLSDHSTKARKIVLRQLDHLGTGLAAAVNLLNPQMIVLGGFLASLLAYEREYLERATLASSLSPSAKDLQIAPSQLGENLLAIGAAQLAFEPLLENPSIIATL
jgi:predicted NBD/HSP70 family sugar kinase